MSVTIEAQVTELRRLRDALAPLCLRMTIVKMDENWFLLEVVIDRPLYVEFDLVTENVYDLYAVHDVSNIRLYLAGSPNDVVDLEDFPFLPIVHLWGHDHELDDDGGFVRVDGHAVLNFTITWDYTIQPAIHPTLCTHLTNWEQVARESNGEIVVY